MAVFHKDGSARIHLLAVLLLLSLCGCNRNDSPQQLDKKPEPIATETGERQSDSARRGKRQPFLFPKSSDDSDSFQTEVVKSGSVSSLSIPAKQGLVRVPNRGLKALQIDNCRLTRPDALGKIGKLEHINSIRFRRCKLGLRAFDDLVCNARANAKLALAALSFTSCQIAGAVYERIAMLPDLRTLEVNDCNLEDDDLMALSKCNLSHLILIKTQITDAGLTRLYEMDSLRTVQLDIHPGLSLAGIKVLRKHLPEANVNVLINQQ